MAGATMALVRKDLRLFLRDRTALFFALLLPIGLATVMGTALGGQMGGGGGASVQTTTIAVEDRAGTESSRALVASIEAAEGLRVEPVEDARRTIADGKRAAGLLIAETYGTGASGGLTLYRDPARQIASQVVMFQLAPILVERMASELGSGMMPRLLDVIAFPAAGRAAAEAALRNSYESIDAITRDLAAEDELEGGEEVDLMQSLPRFLGLEVEDLAPERDDGLPRSAGASHAFSAMAVMMLLFNLVALAGTLQDERAEGTLDRLRLTPAAGRAVLVGKMAVAMIVALVQLAVLFTFGAVAFDVPVVEHLPELALISIVWAFAASALGLVFATACRTRKQMEGLSTLVILGMSAVGGAWFPREITPEWFQRAGLATPVAWAMDAYHGVLWYGKGILPTAERGGVWLALMVLVAAGALMLLVAARFYARRFGSR